MSFVMLRFLSVPTLLSVASITGYIRTIDIPWYLRSLVAKLLKSKSDRRGGTDIAVANSKAEAPVKKVLGKKGSAPNMPKLPKTHVIAQELLAHALFFTLNAVVVFALPYDEGQVEAVVYGQNSTNIKGWCTNMTLQYTSSSGVCKIRFCFTCYILQTAYTVGHPLSPMFCFVFYWKFWLPIGLHSSCSNRSA